jgi:PKD repeat protein
VYNPQHTYINYGTYVVTLTYGSRVSVSKNILITAEPVADFIGFPTRGPANLTVQFTDLSQSVVPLTTWFWNFGDGSFSSDQHPGHTYYTPGMYNVTLNVTNTLGEFNILKKTFYIDVR